MYFETPKLNKEIVLDQALEKIEGKGGALAPDPDEFRGVDGYDDEKIDEHIDYVKDRETMFREDKPRAGEMEKIGRILEEILNEQIAGWLAENISLTKASRYDDIRNGVDSIAEIKEKDSTKYLALAIDATYGDHTENKFKRIKHGIDQGRLSRVEYFKSADGLEKKRLLNIPRVVVAADKQKVLELAELWINGQEEELKNHPIRFQIMEEIIGQLKEFKRYADKIGKINLAKVYNSQLRVFERFQQEKLTKAENPDFSYRDNDNSFVNIQKVLGRFEGLEA